jgi:short-subunit dehydrogenase
MRFADRYGPWAIVAGASEGVGRALARQIAAHGVPSVLLARREAPLAALAHEIRAESGVACVTAAVDLSAPDAMAQIVEAVGSREIGLFGANAGADPNGARFLDRDVEVWLELTQRGVMTTVRCCHHFGGRMRARGRGGLLLMNSGACYGGGSFMATYTANKAFMLCFAESLWAELRSHGVDVLTVPLGVTDTPALHALLAQQGSAIPPQMASPDAVAEISLARLPHGPVHNWGLADDEAGLGFLSASARRARVLTIDQGTRPIFGAG